jgi:hypothetical protein
MQIPYIISSCDGNDLAGGSNPTRHYSTRRFGPTIGTTKRQCQDVLPVLDSE